MQPFAFGEQSPRAPNFATEEAILRARVTEQVTAENAPTVADRLTPVCAALGAGALGTSILWAANLGVGVASLVGATLAVLVGVVVGQLRGRRRVAAIGNRVDSRMASEWPALRNEIARTHEDAVAAFEARRSQAETEWARQEQERVAWAKRLVDGDAEAMHEAISNSLADLDFPFDTHCAVGIEDEAAAFLALDLPEIEDVIPETRYQVLKTGQLKEVKRKTDERNASYARLVAGLAVMMAAAAFAAAPTLKSVTVGAYTQRKGRGLQAVEDQYVYESRILRELFRGGPIAGRDPVDLLMGQQTRVEWGGKHDLKKIAPPPWAAELVES